RETGAASPGAGASKAFQSPAGAAGSQPANRTHRLAGSGSGNGQDKAYAPPHTATGKKRRKRKRGRKVLAKDRSAATGALATPVPGREAPGGKGPVAARSIEVARPASPGNAAAPAPLRRPDTGALPAFAALDLGTNNCRLLVAVPGRPGQFRVIDAFSRIVRLGEGLSSSGRLGGAAMDRAVEALKVCADKLGTRKVRKARLTATEACRAAENGAEFLARVEEEAGLKLEIIDRKTEARLAVSGCGPLVERGTDGVVLFDIGGGS